MNRYIWLITALFLLLAGTAYGKTKWVITDTYVGAAAAANYTQNTPLLDNKWREIKDSEGNTLELIGDVISLDDEINKFNIDGMVVRVKDNGRVTVNVRTDYNTGTRDTVYGDLFIGVSDYTPNTSFDPDSATWNYVFNTKTKNVFSTDNGSFVTSEDIGRGYYDQNTGSWNYDNFEMRNGEEYAHHVESDTWVRVSEIKRAWNEDWYRHDGPTLFDPNEDADGEKGFFKDKGDFLKYGFDLSDLGIDNPEDGYELAFRWSMTCSNDIMIAGGLSVPPSAVPEPGTLALLGLGVLGISAVSRKRRRT